MMNEKLIINERKAMFKYIVMFLWFIFIFSLITLIVIAVSYTPVIGFISLGFLCGFALLFIYR